VTRPPRRDWVTCPRCQRRIFRTRNPIELAPGARLVDGGMVCERGHRVQVVPADTARGYRIQLRSD